MPRLVRLTRAGRAVGPLTAFWAFLAGLFLGTIIGVALTVAWAAGQADE